MHYGGAENKTTQSAFEQCTNHPRPSDRACRCVLQVIPPIRCRLRGRVPLLNGAAREGRVREEGGIARVHGARHRAQGTLPPVLLPLHILAILLSRETHIR